jgi:FAD/FMN-containing dehydrogenase
MVMPSTVSEVVSVLSTIRNIGAKFAIRSGGHGLNEGFANIANGVTINLRSLNQVTVDQEKSVVQIGGGAKWGEVYPVLDKLGLTTAGARVADVGVGGSSTGGMFSKLCWILILTYKIGGISYFSGTKGFTCDSILNYQIVLADGQIVEANRNSHPDLYRALKGGTNNFGIITRFDLTTFTQGDILGGVIAYDISTIQTQLRTLANMIENPDFNAALTMSISYNQPKQGFSIFSALEYAKSEPNPDIFKPFLEAQPQFLNTMRITNVTDVAVEIVQFSPMGSRYVKIAN